MANLPPRPKTPPILPDERRLPIDDRDRDRRSAQPMAPPGRFRDRHPDVDRPYHPPPRRLDTYVPGGYDRRDIDRRDYDSRNRPRDYDRDRDRDRDRRLAPRDRDYSRSPRRHSPDRDRRPYDRDRPPFRRGPSPFRRPGPGPPRRDSRSPPRRRYSPSPPPRSKYRSRSRSPRRLSPPPYRRVRLGNHSIEPSSRPRSPYRRPHSRDRSLSPSKRTGNVESPHRREPEHIETKPPMPSASKTNDAMEVGPVGAKPELKVEQQDSELPSSDIKPSVESPATIEAGEIEAEEIQNTNMEKKESEHMQVDALEELPAALIVTPSAVPPLTLEPHIIVANVAVPERKIERDEKKMDVVEPSPTKPLPSAPASSQARYTPPRSPPHYDQRAIPTGPQRNRRSPPPSRPRSPPRAPRNHPRPITTQNSSSSSSYPLREYPPREPRRNYQQEPAFSSPVSAKVDHDLRLPKIPRYQAPRHMAELELELAKHPHKTCYTPQYLQQMKGLQRALHELDMATIDLQAAEARRLVANSQLEKAKIGCLGIDAKEIVDVAL